MTERAFHFGLGCRWKSVGNVRQSRVCVQQSTGGVVIVDGSAGAILHFKSDPDRHVGGGDAPRFERLIVWFATFFVDGFALSCAVGTALRFWLRILWCLPLQQCPIRT